MSLDTTLLEQLEIAPLNRFDMYAQLGLVRVMEPETEMLMRELADRELREDEYDSPHSRPWFVSMHGSEFPGVPENACSRYLAYRMMNFPAGESMPPWVTTTGTVGKAGELDIVNAWWHGGRMLAIPESANQFQDRMAGAARLMREGKWLEGLEMIEAPAYHQLGFVDADHWMTVSTDLPILQKGWRRPHIVEIKCKADDVLDEMLEGRLIQNLDGTLKRIGRGAEERHAIQLKATIGKATEFDWGWVTVCPHCWHILWAELYEKLGIKGGVHPRSDAFGYCPRCQDYVQPTAGHERDTHFQIESPTSGEIYYWSRSWPRKTKSFYYELDQPFMEQGLKVLAATRAHYINDEIPPRPEHFQWGLDPCSKCIFRKPCRLDSGLPPRARNPRPELVRTKLTESNGVELTRELRPDYNPHATRERVFQEWR